MPWNSRPQSQPDFGSHLIYPNHNCPHSLGALCSLLTLGVCRSCFLTSECFTLHPVAVLTQATVPRPAFPGASFEFPMRISCSVFRTPITVGFHLIYYTSQLLLSSQDWFTSPPLVPKFCERRDRQWAFLLFYFALF